MRLDGWQFQGLKRAGSFAQGCLALVRKEFFACALGKGLVRIILGITIPAACVALIVLSRFWDHSPSTPSTYDLAQMGRELVLVLFITLLACGVFIIPSLSAGAFSREREQETFDLLLLTRLSNEEIIGGKWLAAFAITAFLSICMLPIVALSFLLGGVSPGQLLAGWLIILTLSACQGALGVFISTFCRRTHVALLLAIIFSAFWIAGIPLLLYLHDLLNLRDVLVPSLPYTGLLLYIAWLLVRILVLPLGKLLRRPPSRTLRVILTIVLMGCLWLFIYVASINTSAPMVEVLYLTIVAYVTWHASGLIATPLGRLFRRPSPQYLRIVLTCGLVLGIVAVTFTFIDFGGIGGNVEDYVLFGNPLLGLVSQFDPNHLASVTPSQWPADAEEWCSWAPSVLATQILGCLLFLRLAIWRFKRERRLQRESVADQW